LIFAQVSTLAPAHALARFFNAKNSENEEEAQRDLLLSKDRA